jgi:WD40 repeat protein
VFCGDHYGRIDVRDLATGSVLDTLDGQHGNTGMLWPATDGTELVSFANNLPIVSRWRLDGSGPVTRLVAHGRTTGSISPDSTTVIARRPTRDGRRLHMLRDWEYSLVDVRSGDEIQTFDAMVPLTWMAGGTILVVVPTAGGVQLARYEPDRDRLTPGDTVLVDERTYAPSVDPGKGRVLVAQGASSPTDATLRAVDASGYFDGPAIPVSDYSAASISSSGDYVAAATTRGVDVFDQAGFRLGSIDGDDIRIAFITVADQLFVATLGGELVRYDLETLQPISTFGGSRGAVQELVGTDDGSLIAVRGGDGRVSLYDVATQTAIGAPFEMSADDQLAVALSLDGRTLAYGGGRDSAIRLVDLTTEGWVDAACRVAGRNLTEQEWHTYIGDLARFRPTCPFVESEPDQ